MASQVIETMKASFLQIKKESLTNPVSDEILAASLPQTRLNIDNLIMSMYQVPECFTLENRQLNNVPGEFARYDDSDPQKNKAAFILYIHGGAFENGSVISKRPVTLGLSKGLCCDSFSVDYIQWPEGRFEEGFKQCIDAYKGVLDLGYDAKNVIIAGESAGATMTLAVTLYLKDNNIPLPGNVVVYSPVCDLEDTYPSRKERDDRDVMITNDVGRSMCRHYYDGKEPKNPYHSVRYGNYAGFPRTFIGVATDEVLFDDSCDLHETLLKNNVDVKLVCYEDLFHTFQVVPCEESDHALDDTITFLKA